MNFTETLVLCIGLPAQQFAQSLCILLDRYADCILTGGVAGGLMSALPSSLSNHQSIIREPRPRLNVRRRRLGSTVSSNDAPPKTGEGIFLPAISAERQLIQQAIAGDSNAQEQLFVAHSARLYRTAYAVLRNKEDAEDALQEGWCKAFANLRSFEGRSSFSTWLTRIVINSALMIHRRKNVRPQDSLDELADNQPERLRHRMVHAGPSPEELCAITEINGLVEDQVRELPPGLRAAVQLCDLEGFSAAESIRVLGIRMSAFKSRISRARQKIAEGLQSSLQPPTGRVSAAGAI